MKTIRYVTAGLLLLISIPVIWGSLFFAPYLIIVIIIVYFTPAVLLIMKKKFALYWGIIIAFISLVYNFIKFLGYNNNYYIFLDYVFSIIAMIINVALIIFCLLLLQNRNWVKSL